MHTQPTIDDPTPCGCEPRLTAEEERADYEAALEERTCRCGSAVDALGLCFVCDADRIDFAEESAAYDDGDYDVDCDDYEVAS